MSGRLGSVWRLHFRGRNRLDSHALAENRRASHELPCRPSCHRSTPYSRSKISIATKSPHPFLKIIGLRSLAVLFASLRPGYDRAFSVGG